MENPATVEQEPDSGYSRLEQQISWYDRKSKSAQNRYKLAKLIEISCAALVPLFASISGFVTAGLGVGIVILEAMQHMNQWYQNWITYRSTCEALRHEKYSYIGRAATYEGKSDAEALRTLVSRVESLISTEHSKWISRQEYENKQPATSGTQTHRV